MNNNQIDSIVKAVMAQLGGSGALQNGSVNEAAVSAAVQTSVQAANTSAPADNTAFSDIEDIASPEVKHRPLLENPADPDGLQRMLSKTPARIGVGKAGARLKTKTYLALRADHAAARDSVFADVDEGLIKEMNLFSVQTCCHDRNEHLTRPDLGRKFDEKTAAEIKSHCTANPDVQFIVSDGLSSKAIEANIKNVLPAVMDGVKALGYSVGTPFFVKFGRVACMDHAGELLGSKVTCILIGERPGLGTAESMSAYITYGSKVGMSESLRTVVSNIHKGGITPVEAGAYLAEVIDMIMKNKASGVNLKK